MTFVALTGAQDQQWVFRIVRRAGPDFWLAVAAAWVAGMVLVWLVARAATCRPDLAPRRLLRDALGPWVGGLLQALLALYLLAEAARFLRVGVNLVHFLVLPRTPSWVLVAMGLMPALLLLGGGLAAVVRFGSISFWPSVVLAAVLYVLGLRFGDLGNVLPVLSHGPAPVWAGVPGMIEPVLGSEVLFALAPAAMAAGAPAGALVRGALLGAAGRAFMYWVDSLLLQMAFGPFELVHLKWPLVELTRVSYLPGFIRLDLAWLAIILVAVMAATSLFLWAAWWLGQGLGMPGAMWGAGTLLLTVAVFASWWPSLPALESWWSRWSGPGGLLLALVSSLLLPLTKRWRRVTA